MKENKNHTEHWPVITVTPAVFRDLSDRARALLEGFVQICEDPQWQLLEPAPVPVRIDSRRY